VTPRLTAAFLIITLASIGLPGLNGFVGEFLIMLGAFRWDPRYVVGAGLGVILSAVYMLWMFQRVFYGPVTHTENDALPDLRPREWAAAVPLCAMAIVMGVFPVLFLKPMEPAAKKLVEQVGFSQPVRVENGIRNVEFGIRNVAFGIRNGMRNSESGTGTQSDSPMESDVRRVSPPVAR